MTDSRGAHWLSYVIAVYSIVTAISQPRALHTIVAMFWVILLAAEIIINGWQQRRHRELQEEEDRLLAERDAIVQSTAKALEKHLEDMALIWSVRHKFRRDNN